MWPVVLTCHDARVQQRLILEVHTCGDQELGEVLRAEIPLADGRGETSPEGSTCEPKGRQRAGSGLGKGVVNSTTKAGPEICSLGWCAVGQGLGRVGGEDADKLSFVVVWEMDVRREGVEQGARWWVCEYEDGRHGRDLVV